MNILRIIASMDPATGGPCQGIRNSVPELKRIGLRNEIVCLDDPSSPFLSEDLCKIHALGIGKGPWKYNSKLVPWLLKNLHRFDVVIMHGLWLYPSHAVTKAMKIFKSQTSKNKTKAFHIPKLFVMPHGMLDPYFQKDPGRKLKALRNWIYWKLFESKVVNRADGLLFTCEGEMQLAREPFRPYYPKKEINIGYGIQSPPPFEVTMTKAFLEKCPQVQAQPFILFLSRIHAKKGIDNLIKAYSKVIERKEQENSKTGKLLFPKLVIAGPGIESPYGKKMQKLVSVSETLQQLIFFPGMLTGNAKWGAFYECDAFILPSHQENFGIAVVESLACSKLVLISNKVNIWQEISFNNAGFVNSNTLDGTINLLNDFLSLTEEEKNKMGRQANLTYEKYFNVSVIAHQLIDAIS